MEEANLAAGGIETRKTPATSSGDRSYYIEGPTTCLMHPVATSAGFPRDLENVKQRHVKQSHCFA